MEWVIKRVREEAEKTELELCWDTDIKDLPDLCDEHGQLLDQVITYLWTSAGKIVSEQVVYLRARELSQLIQQFDKEHPYRRDTPYPSRTWGSSKPTKP